MPSWWWDPIVLAQAQVVLGVVGALAAIVAVAFGIWVARRQFAMMTEQGRIVERQVQLAEEQTATLGRQRDLAETQNRIVQAQLAKRTDLRVIVQGIDSHFGSNQDPSFTVRFHAHNGGDKSTDGFYWEVLVGEDIGRWIDSLDSQGNELNKKVAHLSASDHYWKVDGHYSHRLWGYTGVEIVRMAFKLPNDRLAQFTIKWRIRGEDGMVPQKGLAFIKFKAVDGSTYSWSSWHPGQNEIEVQ